MGDVFKPRPEPGDEMPLYSFIAHILYQTQHLPESSLVAFAALMYTRSLKTEFQSSPKARVIKGLFLSAYMVAAKSLVKNVGNHPMTMTWEQIGSVLFELEEMSMMERGVLESLEWRTAVDRRGLVNFMQLVKEQYRDSGPRGIYYPIIDTHIPFSTPDDDDRDEAVNNAPNPNFFDPPASPFIPPLLSPSPPPQTLDLP
jgi:hypothetical protein